MYSDLENIEGRRVLDGGSALEVYADGVRMETQPEITLDSETPENIYGAQAYTYTIQNLPVYREGTTEKIAYTVKEEDVLKGYEAFTKKALNGADDAQAENILESLVSPKGEVKLVQGDSADTQKAEKKFGNYLPVYEVSGTVTWQAENGQAVRPDMESYFKNQFQIVRSGDTKQYSAYKMHYEQSKEDENVWKYTVYGLFTTKADGSSAY